jgi:hypothetical protein
MFRGDTDMVTAGLASLSSICADEIVVAEMNVEEVEDEAGDGYQRRINGLLGRDDLRFVRLRRVEPAFLGAGISFQEFRRAYAPPRLVFECPHCGLDAMETRLETPTDYRRGGGTLTIVPDLDLRG